MSQQAPTLTKLGSRITVWERVALGAAFFAGLAFVVGFVFPYLSLDPQTFGSYWPRRGWLVLHIVGGAAALLLGPLVLWLGLNRRRMTLHRTLGIGYMTSVAFSSVGAFYLAFHTDVSWVFGMGLAGLGTAWITTTGLALISIRRHSIAQHKEWMIRSYVVTFAFVNFRILAGALGIVGVGTMVEQLSVASWFCWSIPLLMTEVILQGRKIFAATSTRDAF